MVVFYNLGFQFPDCLHDELRWRLRPGSWSASIDVDVIDSFKIPIILHHVNGVQLLLWLILMFVFEIHLIVMKTIRLIF